VLTVNDPLLIALGKVVLAAGRGPDDVNVLALWQVSPEGIATGAWVMPESVVFGQPEFAKQFLACANRRAITGQDRDSAAYIMTRLSETAGIRLPQPPGALAVSEALLISRLLRWLVGLWSETEQTKNQRRYVGDAFGLPTALPPRSLNSVQAAYHSKVML
jgi:hypothetical protein